MKPRAQATAAEVRRLGAVFLAAAFLLGALAAWKARSGTWPWQIWAAAVFGAAGLACLALGARARILHRAWTALGVGLGKVVSPLVLAALYFLVVTPFGLAFRALRGDSMGLRPDRSAATYWRKPATGKTSRARMLRQY